MTDNEIIKALEICENYKETCEYCPYDNIRHCEDEIRKDALNLIKRQQAEIERLEAEVDTYVTLAKDMHAKAIKEFVDKLKEIGTEDGAYGYVGVLEIERAAKEMVGDSNES